MRMPILRAGIVLTAMFATGAACQTPTPGPTPFPSPVARPSPSPNATPTPSARPPAPDPATITDPSHASHAPPENPDNSAADTRDDQPPKR